MRGARTSHASLRHLYLHPVTAHTSHRPGLWLVHLLLSEFSGQFIFNLFPVALKCYVKCSYSSRMCAVCVLQPSAAGLLLLHQHQVLAYTSHHQGALRPFHFQAAHAYADVLADRSTILKRKARYMYSTVDCRCCHHQVHHAAKTAAALA